MGLAAAGGLALAGAVSAAGPAGVEDRGANIKITRLRGIPCRPQNLPQGRNRQERRRLGRSDRCEPKVAARAGRVALRAARRREPHARRAPLAEAVPLPPRHARRRHHGPRHLRHRHGLVGHYGETLGRAGLPPPRRPARDKVRMYPQPKATKLGTGGPHPFSGCPSRREGLVEVDRKSPQGEGAGIRHHVRLPLRHPAGHADPVRVRGRAVQRAVAGGAGLPGNVEVFKRLKQQIHIPSPSASATAPSGR